MYPVEWLSSGVSIVSTSIHQTGFLAEAAEVLARPRLQQAGLVYSILQLCPSQHVDRTAGDQV